MTTELQTTMYRLILGEGPSDDDILQMIYVGYFDRNGDDVAIGSADLTMLAKDHSEIRIDLMRVARTELRNVAGLCRVRTCYPTGGGKFQMLLTDADRIAASVTINVEKSTEAFLADVSRHYSQLESDIDLFPEPSDRIDIPDQEEAKEEPIRYPYRVDVRVMGEQEKVTHLISVLENRVRDAGYDVDDLRLLSSFDSTKK